MKIIKRDHADIPREEAHGGSGTRQVLADAKQLKSQYFEAMAHSYLPAGNSFDWHYHIDIEEIMLILKGSGKVFDEDGEYDYSQGDVFIFPANTHHKISNPSKEEHEMIFVRIKA